ncbi:MAG: flagellar basal body protein [Acidimicrobiia bacterium]
MNDVAFDTMHAALRALNVREKALANNIANAETPGFIATKVDFEGKLQEAITKGDPLSASATVTHTADAANINGNNVQLDDQSVALIDTGLKYQLMVQGINSKFQWLRTAIQER